MTVGKATVDPRTMGGLMKVCSTQIRERSRNRRCTASLGLKTRVLCRAVHEEAVREGRVARPPNHKSPTNRRAKSIAPSICDASSPYISGATSRCEVFAARAPCTPSPHLLLGGGRPPQMCDAGGQRWLQGSSSSSMALRTCLFGHGQAPVDATVRPADATSGRSEQTTRK